MEKKEFKYDTKRFLIIAAILIVMWAGFMVFFYLKAEEITQDPCGICAKRHGEAVYCTFINTLNPVSKIYYPNFTEEEKRPVAPKNKTIPQLNVTDVLNKINKDA